VCTTAFARGHKSARPSCEQNVLSCNVKDSGKAIPDQHLDSDQHQNLITSRPIGSPLAHPTTCGLYGAKVDSRLCRRFVAGFGDCRLCRQFVPGLRPCTQRQQSRKDHRHSGDKNHQLSTKSTKLNMFNFGDNVDRDTVDKVERVGDSRLSTNRRQIGDKVEVSATSPICRRFWRLSTVSPLCRPLPSLTVALSPK